MPPNAFLPIHAENDQLTRYKAIDAQLQQGAQDRKNYQRGIDLVALYNRKPWLSPGIATAFQSWKEQFGAPAAQGLARAAYTAPTGGAPNLAQQIAGPFADPQQDAQQKALEDFVGTKDFQRQVADFRKGAVNNKDWVTSYLADQSIPKEQRKGVAQQYANSVLGNSLPTPGDLPGIGPTIKGVSRAAFTALETPYQELQAAGSSVIAHAAQAFTGAAQSTTGGPPPTSATPSLIAPPAPDTGLQVGNVSPFGTSSGAIALGHAISGQPVDLGTGFLPGGQVEKEHAQAVRNIASLTYGGQQHFATPGRIFASAVTEPGTDPFNILSGSIDALAITKTDPANLALGKLEDIKAARAGFSAPGTIEEAGGIRSMIRAATHGPTVDVFLDEQRRGGALLDDLAQNFAGQPEKMAELARRTGWQWPADVYASIASSVPGDRPAMRSIMGDALGAAIPEQPKLHTFAAQIKNVTQQSRAFAEVPSVSNDLSALSGPNGTLRSIYNHAIGLGLDDAQISTHLHDIASAAGKVERGQAIVDFMNMEGTALKNMGLPDAEFKRLSSFAMQDLNNKARVYYDGNITRGDGAPGLMLGGEPVNIEGPYTQSEHLGNRLWLPPLLGPDGRNRAIAKYGRIMGIPGTGFTDMEGVQGVTGLAESAYRGARDMIAGSNTWAINAQNKIWKPVALLRGAWMLRVIGEEQVRMAMAGYDSLFSHPLNYLMQTFQHAKVGSQAEKDLLDYGADMGAMRHAQDASFGLTDPNTSAFGRIIGKNTRTVYPGDSGFGKVWADKLINYHEDPTMNALANELGSHQGGAVDNIKQQFWDGPLAGNRADLSTSQNLFKQGFDLSTRHGDGVNTFLGADDYIDELYNRLHYYTGGDPGLVKTVAHGTYNPDLGAIANVRSIKGKRVVYDGSPGEVVEHKARSGTATVLFDETNNAEKVAVKDLELHEVDQPKVLTRSADNVRVDTNFTGHLDAQDPAIMPEQVSGTTDIRAPNQQDFLDRTVRNMFAVLMDRPTTYMSRSQTFLQAYLNHAERVLPYMAPDEQQKMLDQAAEILHQTDEHTIRGRVLRGRYKQLEEAAKTSVAPTAEVTAPEGYETWYHGTSKAAAADIRKNGFRGELSEQPDGGISGGTVWMSRDKWIAQRYADDPDFGGPNGDVVKIFMPAQEHDLGGEVPEITSFGANVLKRDAKFAPGPTTGLSFEEADDIAKSKGLDDMRDLLYDAHKKNRTLAALQLVMPFGEAFKEMVGSWGRIIAEHPGTTARKFQIGVTAARGANPFDFLPGGSAVPGQGFMYKDPSKQGQETFAYPFTGAINEQLFGVNLEQTAPVQGLSMGLQLMPGVGPVFSMPAMYLMNRFLKDPKWDPLRQIISPYGTTEPQPLTQLAQDNFFPAWMRKVMTATDGDIKSGTQSAKALNNLTMDVMAAGLDDGTYQNNTTADITHAFNDAYTKARWLYAFQGSFQFGAPAAPSFDFVANDKNGKAMRFSMMRDVYYKLVAKDSKNGTNDAAKTFMSRFGEQAMFVVAPKTIGGTFGQQYTEAQYAWTRNHQDLVDKYPTTFTEFAPPAKPNDSFSYDSYLRALTQGEKTTLDPKEWAARTNNVLGTMWYDKVRSDMGLKKGDSGSRSQQLFLADKRNEIHAVYPGFRQVATNDVRIPNAVNELIQASTDPAIYRSNPKLSDALHEYVTYRQGAVDFVKRNGGSGDFSRPGFAQGIKWSGVREDLRNKAAEIGKTNPQFLTLWQDTFAREMSGDN